VNKKVIFELEHDRNGYPPIEFELLNVTSVSGDNFRIDNAPFFVREISYNDVVKAKKSEVKGQYHFVEVVEPSAFTSISIIILNREMDVYLMDLLRGLNCVVEFGEFGRFRILAVAIPETTDYHLLKIQLETLESQNKLSFEELAVAHD